MKKKMILLVLGLLLISLTNMVWASAANSENQEQTAALSVQDLYSAQEQTEDKKENIAIIALAVVAIILYNKNN